MTSLSQWTFYSSVAIFQLHQRMEFTFDISYVNSKLCLLTAFSRWHKSYPNNVTLLLCWSHQNKKYMVVMTNWLIVTKYSFFRWQWIMSFYQHYVVPLSTTKPLPALTVAFLFVLFFLSSICVLCRMFAVFLECLTLILTIIFYITFLALFSKGNILHDSKNKCMMFKIIVSLILTLIARLCARIAIIFTCGKYLHDCIISSRGDSANKIGWL